MVCIDGSKDSESALEFAIDLLKDSEEIELCLVSISYFSDLSFQFQFNSSMNEIFNLKNDTKVATRNILWTYGRRCRERNVKKFSLHSTTSSSIPTALLDISDKLEPDYIFVGRRGINQVARWIIGSTSSALLMHSKWNVCVVKVDKEIEHPTEQKSEAEEVREAFTAESKSVQQEEMRFKVNYYD